MIRPAIPAADELLGTHGVALALRALAGGAIPLGPGGPEPSEARPQMDTILLSRGSGIVSGRCRVAVAHLAKTTGPGGFVTQQLIEQVRTIDGPDPAMTSTSRPATSWSAPGVAVAVFRWRLGQPVTI